jgi:hypothetical protein
VKFIIEDARPDLNDPGEPDTLFLSTPFPFWDGTGAISMECLINNDSDITAFSTGFTWDDDNLICDSLLLGPELSDADFQTKEIFNETQTLYVSAFYFTPTAFTSGAGTDREQYFNAWFHLQDPLLWDAISQIKFDTTKVGTSGEFLFDHGEHTLAFLSFVDANFPMFLSEVTKYAPLIKLSNIQAPVAAEDNHPPVPYTFGLRQNVPNPFNPSTTISFSLDRASDVTLTVYNILGQRVRVLLDEHRAAGEYEVIWDGRAEAGNTVASGIYFYRLASADRILAKKMVLIR